ARDHPRGKLQLALPRNAELDVLVEIELALLAAERLGLSRRGVGEHEMPVGALEPFVDLPRRHAAGIQPAHHRADARAGDVVDRDAQFFERFQRADVSHARRPATAQDEADLWPRRAAPLVLRTQRETVNERRDGEDRSRNEPGSAADIHGKMRATFANGTPRAKPRDGADKFNPSPPPSGPGTTTPTLVPARNSMCRRRGRMRRNRTGRSAA